MLHRGLGFTMFRGLGLRLLGLRDAFGIVGLWV